MSSYAASISARRAPAREDAADASEASASSTSSNDPGNRSSSASGRHRPCDRAPPTPVRADSTSLQKCARSSMRRRRAFSSTAAGTCGGSLALPARFMCPPCRDRDRRRLGRLGRPGRLARLARRARARPPRGASRARERARPSREPGGGDETAACRGSCARDVQ